MSNLVRRIEKRKGYARERFRKGGIITNPPRWPRLRDLKS